MTRAQFVRGARRHLEADLKVALFVLQKCKAGGRGQAVLTDAEISTATRMARQTVFRAKQRLCRARLFTWRVLGGHRGSKYTLRR